jgi:uncharacterized repeat protein (TIGR01451 family)/fimbrial isopeptide formation D2 family protein
MVLVAVCAALPLWLGLAQVHSASSVLASPPTTPPTPSVLIDTPDEVLIGEDFSFEVKFKNNPNSVTGYGPYIELYLPAKGADSNAASANRCDGISFKSAVALFTTPASAPLPPTYDSGLSTNAANLDCAKAYTLPFPGMTPVPQTPSGDYQLVVLELPFGSFEASQPEIVVRVTAHLSDFADQVTTTAGTPLQIFARGGFRYGADALNNHPADPLKESVVVSDPTRPTVLKLKKIVNAPEDETATGPNFLRKYTITADIANLQKIDNLKIQDFLPNNVQYQGMVNVKIGTTTATFGTSCTGVDYHLTQQPSILAAQNPPNNDLEVSFCHQIIGTPAAADITVTFGFYVPEMDANTQTVLPTNCSPVASVNDVKAEGDWTPNDPRDLPMFHISSDLTPQDHILSDKCIAIQKSVAMAIDTSPAGLSPNDTVMYTLQFQISDYKTIGSLVVNDYLSNGQTLTGPVTLTVSDQFGMKSGVIPAPFITQSADPQGTVNFCPAVLRLPPNAPNGTLLTFNISAAMVAIPAFTAPRLNAGIVTGGYAAGPNPPHNPAIGTITFRAQVGDVFQLPVSPGDKYVDKDDPVDNCVRISGKVYQNVLRPNPMIPNAVVAGAKDDSNTAMLLIGDTLNKTVYAVKRANALGVYNPICGPPTGLGGTSCSNFPNAPQEVRPGDQVTYRIEKVIPSSDAENLVIEDWLPQPTYAVAGVSFANTLCSGLPGPGNSCLGPTDTLHSLPVNPTVIPHPMTNSITFNYGTFFDTTSANQTRKIDLLFTYKVTNTPFADGLFLTNEAQECETNTFGASFCQVSIAQVNVRQPNLRVEKGVIAVGNPDGTFTPRQGPTTATLSTAQSPRSTTTFGLNGISGLINSADLAASPGFVNDDLSNVDANDIVVFAITIENLGGSPAYDAKIEEIIPSNAGAPSCFTIVPNSYHVQRGDGTVVNPLLYNLVSSTNGLGFTLTTSNPLVPIPAYNATSGSNIVVVTFQATMLPNIMPGCCDNEVDLLHYASQPGGPDFVAAGFTTPFQDFAKVCVNVGPGKCVTNTSEAHTIPNSSVSSTPNAAIGEIIRYQLRTRIPEGFSTFMTLTDNLPTGMTYQNDGTSKIAIVSDGGLTVNGAGLSGPGLIVPGTSSGCGAVTPTFTVPPSSILGGPSFTPGGAPSFYLGIVTNHDNDLNDEYVIVEFNALVNNLPQNVVGSPNQNGATLSNTYDVFIGKTIQGVTKLPVATSNLSDIKVVEPHLQLTKTASPANVLPGGIVTYTVTATNNGTADAFDVVLTDPLPAGLTFVGGSITANSGCAAPVVSGTSVIVPQIIPGCTVTVTFKAQVYAHCPFDIVNTALADYTSLRANGTASGVGNTTGSITPGASGATDGERKYQASATAVITCNQSFGSLTVNKQIMSPPGMNPPATAVFPVTVSCQPSGYNQTLNLTPSVLTQTFTNIPIGSTCTVTEGPLPAPISNPVCAAMGWSPPVYTPSQTVVITSSAQTVTILNRFGCTIACASPPAGMVGWWPMNVQSNQIHDIAGFDNVGSAQAYQTVNGYVFGQGLGALYFNTTPPSVVSVPSHPELDFVNGDFSIDAWVSIISGGPTAIHPIVDKFNAPAGPGYAFYVRNKHLELNLNGTTFVSTGPPMIPAVNPQGNSGPWYHVAVTVQRNPGRVIFYLNGGQVGSYPATVGPVVNNLPLWIGGTRIAANRLELSVDELELFSRVVSQTEFQTIFNSGSLGKCRQGIP